MTTNAEILTKLEAMHSDIQEIKRTEAARVEREKQLREDVDDLQATVNGNGQEGLKTAVARLADKVNLVVKVMVAVGTVSLAQAAGIAVLFLTHQLPGFNP